MKTMFWRLATLALRLPSPQLGLTAVFGMRTGVTPATNHQNIIFNDQFLLAVFRLEKWKYFYGISKSSSHHTGTSIFLSASAKKNRSLKTKSDTKKES